MSMLSNIINRLSGNYFASSTSASKAKQEKRKRGHIARVEELEGREMLSADLFQAIQTTYSDLYLGNDWERYNYIEINAN